MKAVLVSCFSWYENRLKPIKELLEEWGYDVVVLTSDFLHIEKEYIKNKNKDCKYIHVKKYKRNISIGRIISHLSFGRKVFGFLQQYKPDLIYALVPPNNVVHYCAKYKKNNPSTKFIVDVIDLWPESLPIGKFSDSILGRIWGNIRNKSLPYSDYICIECDLYQEELNDTLRGFKPVSTLHIYKEQSEEAKLLIKKTLTDYIPICQRNERIIYLAYLGSINNIIDIEAINLVVENFMSHGYKIEMRIVGKGESKEKFVKELLSRGVAVKDYGAIYDEMEKIRIIGECDFGINMMKESVKVGLTIKSLDYLSYGLPLINNIKGDTWKVVESAGIGINVKGNKSISLPISIDHYNVNEVYTKYFTKEAFIKKISCILNEVL